jgi:hypothetical protein
MTRLATAGDERSWCLFAFNLPAQPAYGRVKIWRRLQDVGAASFKNAFYLLPGGEAALEDFEWILRDVRQAGGDGVIFTATAVQGMSSDELVALFDAARAEQYRELAESIAQFTAQFERKRARPTQGEGAATLARFRDRLTAIEAIDFFQADGREQVHALLRALEPHAAPPAQTDKEVSAMNVENLDQLRGRTWVTRANVHVDRMASAWLIRRWIDSEARFKFVTDRHYRAGSNELRFDMYEAEFTHDGDRCTFEVLAARLGRDDRALATIGEIVHDLDLKDQKFGREEAAGVQQLLAGIVARCAQDEERLERAYVLFDDLYSSFNGER